MDKLLSVIVTVHNTKGLLKQCVDSVLAQTYKNIEIILVDDGSTDGSEAMCDAYQARHERVRVIHQAEQGQGVGRAVGITAATGEFVHFIDDDDWLEPNMEQVMMNALEKHNADIVACGYFDYLNGKRIARPAGRIAPGVYDRAAMQREIFPNMIRFRSSGQEGILIPLWMKVMRRSVVFDAVTRMDPRIRKHEDLGIVYEAIYAANRLCIIKGNYYHHRRMRPQSNTTKFCPNLYSILETLLNYMLAGPMAKNPAIARQIPVVIQTNISYSENTNGRGKRSPFEMQVRARLLKRIGELRRGSAANRPRRTAATPAKKDAQAQKHLSEE
ncbi:hypothetical protein AGMMS49992_33990 [Clostridia bacterium]|nr:hypothetical protein AGMMS49992_33990 [Clostridia bacterium]